MEVIAVQKSALDGMKNDIKETFGTDRKRPLGNTRPFSRKSNGSITRKCA